MSKKRRKLAECPNCGYEFREEDNFCPVCGQENNHLNIPFHHFILETLENTFHLDTKIFTTLRLLLFSPGRLTLDYLSGKRARYVPPIRMYVFISFVFFLLLSLQSSNENNKIGYMKAEAGQAKKDTLVKEEGLQFTSILTEEEMASISSYSDKQLDSVLVKDGAKPTKFNRTMQRKLAKILENSREFGHKVLKNSSIMMFFLMPFFAWIIYLMYYRKKRHYYECLVFSINLHCFVFFMLSLIALIALFTENGYPALVISLLILVYLFLSLKRVFMQKVFMTLMKTILFIFSYLLTLIFFIVLTFFASILFY